MAAFEKHKIPRKTRSFSDSLLFLLVTYVLKFIFCIKTSHCLEIGVSAWACDDSNENTRPRVGPRVISSPVKPAANRFSKNQENTDNFQSDVTRTFTHALSVGPGVCLTNSKPQGPTNKPIGKSKDVTWEVLEHVRYVIRIVEHRQENVQHFTI